MKRSMLEAAKKHNRMKTTLPLIIFFIFAACWPVAYNAFLHERVAQQLDPSFVSNEELGKLLGVRRFEVSIPEQYDGQYMALVPYIDGNAEPAGGFSARGGSELILLVRRPGDSTKIEYCIWDKVGGATSFDSIDDPLADAGMTSIREAGEISLGDWIFRGGRDSLSSSKPADFELKFEVRR